MRKSFNSPQEKNVWKGKQRWLIILFLEKLIMHLSNCIYSSGLGDIFLVTAAKTPKFFPSAIQNMEQHTLLVLTQNDLLKSNTLLLKYWIFFLFHHTRCSKWIHILISLSISLSLKKAICYFLYEKIKPTISVLFIFSFSKKKEENYYANTLQFCFKYSL